MENTSHPKTPLVMEDLLKLKLLEPDHFVTEHDPWLPIGAQAIFGGTLIAQCMMAAQATVPSSGIVASLHSTFVQGGKPSTPIFYTVQRLHSDCSRWTRAVRASQEGQCIFLATMNFITRVKNPERAPQVVFGGRRQSETLFGEAKSGGGAEECPYICSNLDARPADDGRFDETKIYQWMKTCHSINASTPSVHLAAIAYMSDNYFLPTATRVHGIHWERDPEALPTSLASQRDDREDVKLMVSLDHSIYFTPASADTRADEWMWTEMQSPWMGNERALVSQRVYSGSGALIAIIFQEVCWRSWRSAG
jgi:acyl-CoA thioesterase